MHQPRSRPEKTIAVAAACTTWVIGATLFYRSGGLNPAGVVPTLGCLFALWGATRSDTRLMWLSTAIVVLSAVAFVFSIGLVVAPAAVALVIASLLLSSSR